MRRILVAILGVQVKMTRMTTREHHLCVREETPVCDSWRASSVPDDDDDDVVQQVWTIARFWKCKVYTRTQVVKEILVAIRPTTTKDTRPSLFWTLYHGWTASRLLGRFPPGTRLDDTPFTRMEHSPHGFERPGVGNAVSGLVGDVSMLISYRLGGKDVLEHIYTTPWCPTHSRLGLRKWQTTGVYTPALRNELVISPKLPNGLLHRLVIREGQHGRSL